MVFRAEDQQSRGRGFESGRKLDGKLLQFKQFFERKCEENKGRRVVQTAPKNI